MAARRFFNSEIQKLLRTLYVPFIMLIDRTGLRSIGLHPRDWP